MRANTVPAGDVWLHEVKFDGYRVQAHKAGSRVVIYSRYVECKIMWSVRSPDLRPALVSTA
jgi:bifunctional non-homologous end joining protein LigD